MDLITSELRREILDNIVKKSQDGDFDTIGTSIMDTIVILHQSIPDKKRISYGIHSVIKELGNAIYKLLVSEKMDVLNYVENLFRLESIQVDKKEDRILAVGLKVLASWACEEGNDYRKTLPYFERGATSEYWEVREHVAGFFRMVIKTHKDDIKPWLIKCVKSDQPNLRRMIAEALRPVADNRWLQKNPDFSLSILKHMFAEAKPYPRSSIGNGLSDLARQNPDLVYDIVGKLVESGDKNSHWIATRACRNLVKKEPVKVMNLLRTDVYRYKDREYFLKEYNDS